jgi:hypothetical protein
VLKRIAFATVVGVLSVAAASAGAIVDTFQAVESLDNNSASLPFRLMDGVCPGVASTFGGCRDTTLWLDSGSGDNTLVFGNGTMRIDAAAGSQVGVYLIYDDNTDGNIGGSLNSDLWASGNQFTLFISNTSWDAVGAPNYSPIGELGVWSSGGAQLTFWDFELPLPGASELVEIPFASGPAWTMGGGANLHQVNAITLSFNQTNNFVTGLQADVSSFDIDTAAASSTPEPATWGIAGAALLGLGFLRRRVVR